MRYSGKGDIFLLSLVYSVICHPLTDWTQATEFPLHGAEKVLEGWATPAPPIAVLLPSCCLNLPHLGSQDWTGLLSAEPHPFP